MATANLMLHCGAREVSRAELDAVPCPPPEGRWRPVPHGTVLTYALSALQSAGYDVEKSRLGLSRNDLRFWGTLVLRNPIVSGVSLAVAVASSLDKSVSLRWGYGHHVFVCDNGAWSLERTIARKHTTHGVERYREAILNCVGELEQYRQVEAERIRRMQQQLIADHVAEALLLRAYQDEQILSPRTLPVALQEWREPSFVGLEEKNLWRLFNSVTYAIGPRAQTSPQAHAAATIRLGRLFLPAHEDVPETVALAA
jgi:hypothetical protein